MVRLGRDRQKRKHHWGPLSPRERDGLRYEDGFARNPELMIRSTGCHFSSADDVIQEASRAPSVPDLALLATHWYGATCACF
jgi:hypothetical protein